VILVVPCSTPNPAGMVLRVILLVDYGKFFGDNFSSVFSVFGPMERFRGGSVLPLLEVALELLTGAVVNGRSRTEFLDFLEYLSSKMVDLRDSSEVSVVGRSNGDQTIVSCWVSQGS
jgi:hypothetical protein